MDILILFYWLISLIVTLVLILAVAVSLISITEGLAEDVKWTSGPSITRLLLLFFLFCVSVLILNLSLTSTILGHLTGDFFVIRVLFVILFGTCTLIIGFRLSVYVKEIFRRIKRHKMG